MLEDCFSGVFKKYHIDASEDGKLTIRNDCPPDLFEELRESDTRFFRDEGEHLYTNFEEPEQTD